MLLGQERDKSPEIDTTARCGTYENEQQLPKDYGLRRQEGGGSTDDFKERGELRFQTSPSSWKHREGGNKGQTKDTEHLNGETVHL